MPADLKPISAGFKFQIMTKTKTITPPKTDRRKLWSYFDKDNIQHRTILSYCIQFGWSKPHHKTGLEVADLGALDSWLRGKSSIGQSPVKKPLMEMHRAELSKVIFALEQMLGKTFS